MYIDIHCHMLFDVDDGPHETETSLELIRDAIDQGAEALVLTPHHRNGMFETPAEVIRDHFEQLKQLTLELPVQLYLGSECHMDFDSLDELRDGRVFTLAGSDHVLAEFSYMTPYPDIVRYIDMLIRSGYIPVIAHTERYRCFLEDLDKVYEVSQRGALIQVNAGSVMGQEGRDAERFSRKLLKKRLVDVIASDTHDMHERRCRMEECMSFVKRKYGEEYERELFYDAPDRMIHNR